MVPNLSCTYGGCEDPQKSDKFYRIDEYTFGGAQIWTGIEGSLLCQNCYHYYRRKGGLERQRKRKGKGKRKRGDEGHTTGKDGDEDDDGGESRSVRRSTKERGETAHCVMPGIASGHTAQDAAAAVPVPVPAPAPVHVPAPPGGIKT